MRNSIKFILVIILAPYFLLFTFGCTAILQEENMGGAKDNRVIPFPRLEEERKSVFNDIMGFSGYYIDFPTPAHQILRHYYIQDGTCIATSYGYPDLEGEDIVMDLDEDGVTELISNCVAGDGWQRLQVYRLRDGRIEVGHLNENKLIASEENYQITRERYEITTGKVIFKYYFESDPDNYITLELNPSNYLVFTVFGKG